MNSTVPAIVFVFVPLGCVPEVRVVPDPTRDVVLGDRIDAADDRSEASPDSKDGDGAMPDLGALRDTVEVGFDVHPSDDAGSAVDTPESSDHLDAADVSAQADVSVEVVVDAPLEASTDAVGDVAADERSCIPCVLPNATSSCAAGACRIERCNSGFADCNGRSDDGCEVRLGTRDHCGRCVDACGSASSCLSGRCVLQRSCPTTDEQGCGMLPITGGTFQMGSEEATTAGTLPGTVTVSSIVVDTHEVTVARFRRFWMSGHPIASTPVRYPNGLSVTATSVAEPTTMITGQVCNWTSAVGTHEAHPVNCVDWHTALSFCAWDGGRLPTEAEFEFVARARPLAGLPSPRRYPWGNEDPISMYSVYPRPTPCERAQFQACRGDDGALTRRVGSFPENGGLYDLAGNVSEWVADVPENYSIGSCWPVPVERHDPVCWVAGAIARSARGGSYGVGAADPLLGSSRDSRSAAAVDAELGFRCVRSP